MKYKNCTLEIRKLKIKEFYLNKTKIKKLFSFYFSFKTQVKYNIVKPLAIKLKLFA